MNPRSWAFCGGLGRISSSFDVTCTRKQAGNCFITCSARHCVAIAHAATLVLERREAPALQCARRITAAENRETSELAQHCQPPKRALYIVKPALPHRSRNPPQIDRSYNQPLARLTATASQIQAAQHRPAQVGPSRSRGGAGQSTTGGLHPLHAPRRCSVRETAGPRVDCR